MTGKPHFKSFETTIIGFSRQKYLGADVILDFSVTSGKLPKDPPLVNTKKQFTFFVGPVKYQQTRKWQIIDDSSNGFNPFVME